MSFRTMETIEVSIFRADEFVKFDEKLLLRTKRFDGWKISLITTFDYYW